MLLLGAAAATAYRSGWSPPSFQFLARSPAPAQSIAPVGPVKTASALPSGERASRTTPTDSAHDGWKGLVVQVLRLWGVNEDLSEPAAGAWPDGADGIPDLAAIAARYQLSATLLPATSLTELQAVDLPAIVELGDRSGRHPFLLRRIDGTMATLVSSRAEETRLSLDELDAAWTRSAWIIWRNVDLLPSNPNEALTPIVVATLALRLQKLGLLGPPMPTSNDERFQQAVRRFQSSMGLHPDGIVGPRTTLALSRVIAGRFGPTLAAPSPR